MTTNLGLEDSTEIEVNLDDSITASEIEQEDIVLEQVDLGPAEYEVTYPCFVIEGLDTLEELEFFKNKKYLSDLKIPLYCIVEGSLYPVGELEYSLNTFLMLYTFKSYKLKLYSEKNKFKVIDLENPKAAIEAITLGL